MLSTTFTQKNPVTYLFDEAVVVKSGIEVNETEKVANGCHHALSNMIPVLINSLTRNVVDQKFYRGKTSASRTTVLTPSRASADAVYDPPGPPPTTKTVHCSGTESIFSYKFDRRRS